MKIFDNFNNANYQCGPYSICRTCDWCNKRGFRLEQKSLYFYCYKYSRPLHNFTGKFEDCYNCEGYKMNKNTIRNIIFKGVIFTNILIDGVVL